MPIASLQPVTDPADDRLADYVSLTDVALRSRQEPAKGLYIAESSTVLGRALAAGLAIGVAPFALGALADEFGTHQAFLLVPVLAALGAVAAVIGGRAVRRSVVSRADLLALEG